MTTRKIALVLFCGLAALAGSEASAGQAHRNDGARTTAPVPRPAYPQPTGSQRDQLRQQFTGKSRLAFDAPPLRAGSPA